MLLIAIHIILSVQVSHFTLYEVKYSCVKIFDHKFEKVLTCKLGIMMPFDNARFLPCYIALNCAAFMKNHCSYIK